MSWGCRWSLEMESFLRFERFFFLHNKLPQKIGREKATLNLFGLWTLALKIKKSDLPRGRPTGRPQAQAAQANLARLKQSQRKHKRARGAETKEAEIEIA